MVPVLQARQLSLQDWSRQCGARPLSYFIVDGYYWVRGNKRELDGPKQTKISDFRQ